ncbi:hypothetical protein [Cohnella sp. WQ 127256]|uniref:hypothetical protein n=1 Tax=Cohnella sp. WQ 127256 TaxID=2938790 RepID=UPI0021176977|nr:hypothetical protein [Cohnella sp. WQ 127256]
MKPKIIYGIAIVLILASGVGNYTYNRYYQLPEAGYLRHYIETHVAPSVAFDLLYVANNADKRKIVSAQVDELPMLKFHPVQIHQELRHQTIYKLMGYYDGNMSWPGADPVKLHTITTFFSDGSVSEEEVGEIVAYQEVWSSTQNAESGPIQFSSGRSSSDNDGSTSVQITSPVTFTGISSAWLDKLGSLFEYEVKSTAQGRLTSGFTSGVTSGIDSPVEANASVELKSGQSLSLDYRFMLRQSPQAMEVYNLQLQMNFVEPNGNKHDYTVFANYSPYPTEAQMRTYVREQRRQVK